MPHSFFSTEKQGDIITSNTLIVATTMIALFSMSWQLALVSIVVIPLMILPTR